MTDSALAITRPHVSLAVILIGSFMAPLLVHSSTLAIPMIAADLRLDAETLSWFTLLYVLGNAMFILPAGKFADILGRRRIFCFGVSIAAVACGLGANADSANLILAARFMQGVGSAFVFGASLALVRSIPPEAQKTKVMGTYLAICYLGVVAGPLFGGVVLEYLDWRWVYSIPAIVLIVTAAVGFGFLQWERYGDRNTKVRLLDVSLYMLSLVMIAFAVFRTNEFIGQFIMGLGVLSFVGFCWFQAKRRDPLLQVKLFRNNSVFTTLGITHFFNYCSILSLPFTVTLYLQYIKGLDPQTTGLILISQALFTSLFAPFTGWLAARIRLRIILFVGMIVICGAMLLLAMVSVESSVWLVLLSLSLLGLGVGLFDTQLMGASMASVDEQLLGSASATLHGMRTMGGFVGISVVSYLMGQSIGKQQIVPAIYPDLLLVLKQFFIFAAALNLLALLTLTIGVGFRSRLVRR